MAQFMTISILDKGGPWMIPDYPGMLYATQCMLSCCDQKREKGFSVAIVG